VSGSGGTQSGSEAVGGSSCTVAMCGPSARGARGGHRVERRRLRGVFLEVGCVVRGMCVGGGIDDGA
jgi:hypothetical protein